MSDGTAAGSTANAPGDPPVTPQEAVLRPSPRSASISDISSPLWAIGSLINNQSETHTQQARCDPAAAPATDCDAMEEEETHDLRTRRESRGALDLEEEGETEVDNDRCLFVEENLAAIVQESKCVTSTETPSSVRVTPGAPEGWTPPGPPQDWKGPAKHSGIDCPIL